MSCGTTNVWLITLPAVPGGVGALPAVERNAMHLPCHGRIGVFAPAGPRLVTALATLRGATLQPSSVQLSRSAFASAGGRIVNVNDVPPAAIVPACRCSEIVGLPRPLNASTRAIDRENGSPALPTTCVVYEPSCGCAITTVLAESSRKYAEPGIPVTT